MAQKVTVILTDDIDGSEAVRTVQFALYGKTYEIDLNEKHASELDAAMEKFIKAGRAVASGSAGRSRRSTARSTGPDASKVRAWAAMNGIEVNERGRIPKDIIERYERANGKAETPAQNAQKPAEAAEKADVKAEPTPAPKSPQKPAQKPTEEKKTSSTKTATEK